jgi:hypothetical protein
MTLGNQPVHGRQRGRKRPRGDSRTTHRHRTEASAPPQTAAETQRPTLRRRLDRNLMIMGSYNFSAGAVWNGEGYVTSEIAKAYAAPWQVRQAAAVGSVLKVQQ